MTIRSCLIQMGSLLVAMVVTLSSFYADSAPSVACHQAFHPAQSPLWRTARTVLFSSALFLVPNSPLMTLAMAGGSISGGGGGFAYKRGERLILADLLYVDPAFQPAEEKNRNLVPRSGNVHNDLDSTWEIDPKNFAKDEYDFAMRRLETWRAHSPELIGQIIEIMSSNIWRATALSPKHSEMNENSNDRFISDVLLNQGFDPREKVQVAINELDSKKVFINISSWAKLDFTSRSALLIHEALRYLTLSIRPESPFGDRERSLTGTIILKDPSTDSQTFRPFFKTLYRLPSVPKARTYLSREERTDRDDLTKNRLALAEVFKTHLLGHPYVNGQTVALYAIKQLETHRDAHSATGLKNVTSLKDLPIQVRSHWLLKSLNPQLLWSDSPLSQDITERRALAGSLLNRDLVESILATFQVAGDEYAASHSIRAENDFLIAAEALRGLMARLYTLDGQGLASKRLLAPSIAN
jgi:hypothetical protein